MKQGQGEERMRIKNEEFTIHVQANFHDVIRDLYLECISHTESFDINKFKEKIRPVYISAQYHGLEKTLIDQMVDKVQCRFGQKFFYETGDENGKEAS